MPVHIGEVTTTTIAAHSAQQIRIVGAMKYVQSLPEAPTPGFASPFQAIPSITAAVATAIWIAKAEFASSINVKANAEPRLIVEATSHAT